ncbi:MAG: hypothetical protein NZ920_01800 [Aigarchaeota archaeon]|nr:hypothetical protein [Aigarchaeota archaeon]MDW8093177.1 hypothetical protein [Nitrososphaerota archaeon]
MSSQKAKTVDKKVLSINPPQMSEVDSFIRSVQYVTPFTLSERFGIRLSVSKALLSTLEKRGLVRLVTGTNRIRIYQPLAKLEEARPESQRPKESPQKATQTKQSQVKRKKKTSEENPA